MKLSVCVITHNEERFIGKCLASVTVLRPHEIIVVDSGSTDRTVTIAKSYGAVIISIVWRDDFAWARNVAIDQVSGDWVLFLDADEYWEGAPTLDGVLARTLPQVGGFLLERADVYLEPDTGKKISCPVGIVRLFRRNATFRYAYRVHEQINTSISAAGSRIEILKAGRLIHQVYALNPAFIASKQRHYLRLLDEALIATPYDEWLLYQRAKTLWFLQHKEAARQLFQQLSQETTASRVIRCSALCNTALLLQEAGLVREAIAHVQASLGLNPSQSLGHRILGDIYYGQRRFGLAVQCYLRTKTAINTLRAQDIIPGDLYLYPAERLFKIGCCCLAIGRAGWAKILFKWGLRKHPDHLNSLYGLAITALVQRDILAARRYTLLCYDQNPQWERVRELKIRLGIPIAEGAKNSS